MKRSTGIAQKMDEAMCPICKNVDEHKKTTSSLIALSGVSTALAAAVAGELFFRAHPVAGVVALFGAGGLALLGRVGIRRVSRAAENAIREFNDAKGHIIKTHEDHAAMVDKCRGCIRSRPKQEIKL